MNGFWVLGAIQRETWTRTPDGLRLRQVEEHEVFYLRKDGKAMPPPR